MAKKPAELAKDTTDTLQKHGQPRSLRIAERGIKTSNDFAELMSSLMSDLIEGRVTPQVGNATCNAGGKLLKVVEMTYKYGVEGKPGKRTLLLAVGEHDSDRD